MKINKAVSMLVVISMCKVILLFASIVLAEHQDRTFLSKEEMASIVGNGCICVGQPNFYNCSWNARVCIQQGQDCITSNCTDCQGDVIMWDAPQLPQSPAVAQWTSSYCGDKYTGTCNSGCNDCENWTLAGSCNQENMIPC